jgi:hypothetical protein
VEEGLDVDADEAVEFLLGHFVGGRVPLDNAGIVDDYVELAEGIDGHLQGVVPRVDV